jgi:putative transposase
MRDLGGLAQRIPCVGLGRQPTSSACRRSAAPKAARGLRGHAPELRLPAYDRGAASPRRAGRKSEGPRLIREEGLQGRQREAFRPRTTDSNHDGPIAPNRLAQAGPTTACDQVWQADITYPPTRAGWLYLAVVIDAHSKRVLGRAFSPSLETGFVIAALLMAIRRRGGRCAPGLLLHSDRGVQYASERFRAQLAAHRITASMSRRGNCYDNARAEAFFSTLKIELVYRHDLLDHDHARRIVFEWIESFYNLRRRHSSIGNLSPVDFEKQKN